jgi:hypothetical protein
MFYEHPPLLISMYSKANSIQVLEVQIMEYLKRNKCKTTAFTQNKSITINIARIIVLIIIIIFGTVYDVQSQNKTLTDKQLKSNMNRANTSIIGEDEESLLAMHRDWLAAQNTKKGSDMLVELQKKLTQYVRYGCRMALGGEFTFRGQGTVVDIVYDEDLQVFQGRLSKIVDMSCVPANKRLFKVYFDKGFSGPFVTTNMNLAWLREERKCKYWEFSGVETSCDPKTNKQIVSNLGLILNGDELKYIVGRTFYLDRRR